MRATASTRPPAIALVAGLALVTGACGLAGDGGSDAAAPTATGAATGPASIEAVEALRLFVERRLNQGFVPDCDDAERPDDVGKQCTRFRGERDGMLAYELGPTFAEYTRLIILQRVADSWTIAHLETRDPSLPPVPGIPWPIQISANLVVAGTGDCLRIRERPGLRAPEITCLDDGTAVTVISGPVTVDNFEWWELQGYGWAASNWLRYPDEAPATQPDAANDG